MNMIFISNNISLEDNEVEISAMRAQGAGGQNVNKVASAIHLRFDIGASSLPEFYKHRLLTRSDSRITRDGVVIIKAQRYRSQERNREEALERLRELIRSAAATHKRRIPTRPGKAAQERRLAEKARHGQRKRLRGQVGDD